MPNGMNTFDPSQVAVVLGTPPFPISGFMPDTFVTLERDVALFTKHVGADGQVTRVRSANKGAKCTIVLQQGSAANDYLSSLELLDEGPTGVPLNFSMTDKSGRTIATCPYGWVEKLATVTLNGTAEQGRTWVIDLAATAIFVGGN